MEKHLTADPAGDLPRAATGASRWRGAIRVRRAAVVTGIAVAGLVVSTTYGGPLGNTAAHHSVVHQLIGAGSAVVFLVFALIAVRGATQDLLGLLPHAFGDTRMAGLRVICLLSGYALVIIGALSLLHVPWSRLLLGGALTGVILGIAAQPVLGNVCAGLVLLIARPFTVGEEITVQSGPLGGRIEGRVSDMTLLFIQLHTPDGKVLLPNNAVLGAAIGPPERHHHTTAETARD
ncbi:MAG: mechanosensitive ion channel [Streptomyces sp.]|nr:mechanosensitive ion channel [Streptomyces sp.]